MKTGISIAAMIAMLAQGPASALPSEQNQQPRSQTALCRQPAALPRLAPEDQGQYDQQRPVYPEPVLRSVAKESKSDAPASPPPAPSYAEAIEEDGEVVVTSRRMEKPALDSAVPVTVVGSEELASASDRASESKSRTKPAVDGSDAEVDIAHAERMPPPRRYPPQPHAGQLTAGEHDDLLNPELYADYVRRSDLAQWIPGLPSLDTQRVLTVTVKDEAGRPVPFATVELACADGSRLRLSTMADGTVSFFPDLDRLGRKVRLAHRRRGLARSHAGQPPRRAAGRFHRCAPGPGSAQARSDAGDRHYRIDGR